MTKESHPLGSGWLEEFGYSLGTDNIDEVAALGKPNHDHPLTFHYGIDTARTERFCLPITRTKQLLCVRNAIVADLILAHRAGQALSYSRNNNFYAQEARYRGLPFTRGNVFATIDLLRDHGLIEEDRARPGDHRRTQKQSRIQATPRLIELWGDDEATFTYDPHEVIRRKGADRRLTPYDESTTTRQRRKDVLAYNEALNATDITLAAADVNWGGSTVHLPTADGEIIILPFRKTGYRVFNDSWSLGGRFYGPFFQSLPSERRAQILMNGNPVVEHDHSQLHARLLYAEFGLTVDGDAYTIPGHEHRRSLFKVAWQIMINASNRTQGMWALAIKLAAEALCRDGVTKNQAEKAAQGIACRFLREASDTLALLEERHRRVKVAFYTGAGLRLQYVDSRMFMSVTKKALKEGIVAGGVHDSHFAEAGRNDQRVKEIMDDALAVATNTPKPWPVRLPAPSVLHMVEAAGAGAPSPSVPLLAPAASAP